MKRRTAFIKATKDDKVATREWQGFGYRCRFTFYWTCTNWISLESGNRPNSLFGLGRIMQSLFSCLFLWQCRDKIVAVLSVDVKLRQYKVLTLPSNLLDFFRLLGKAVIKMRGFEVHSQSGHWPVWNLLYFCKKIYPPCWTYSTALLVVSRHFLT